MLLPMMPLSPLGKLQLLPPLCDHLQVPGQPGLLAFDLELIALQLELDQLDHLLIQGSLALPMPMLTRMQLVRMLSPLYIPP